MRFMVEWSIGPENESAAMDAFLEGGAPMSRGLKLLGRWNAPGSCRGWLLCETEDVGHCTKTSPSGRHFSISR